MCSGFAREQNEDAMKDVSERLESIVEATEPVLLKIGGLDNDKPLKPGGWSRKQVLGHLIDSASNNHQRFVRALLQPSLDFPAYDQEGCVRVEAVQNVDWKLLVSLWAAYNRYLAHVIAHIPESKLQTPCRIGAGKPVTLEFLARDYVVHLEHHLKQMALEKTS
jgi:hypothetical protein